MALVTMSLLALFNIVKCDSFNSLKFYKTRVVEDIYPFPPKDNVYVKSRLECSAICGRDLNCRKYLYCEANGNKICDTFLDGEDCISGPNQGRCSCFRKGKQHDGMRCTSPIGYYGNECQYIIKDCRDGELEGMPVISLSYIQPIGSQLPFEVFCDHGFTTIQRQSSMYEPVNFNRSWVEYVEGFGELHKGHWLGMTKIKNILENSMNYQYRLTFVFTNPFKGNCYTSFDNFNIDVLNDYSFSGIPTTVTPACYPPPINNIANARFSTFDHGSHKECAAMQGGGWWFTSTCSFTFLNGPLNFVIMSNYHVVESTLRLERI